MDALIPSEAIEKKIFLIRGQKVMLDMDLAILYEVGVKVLNQAVRRNIERFPADFMFQLTSKEAALLRSQTVTLKTRARTASEIPALRLHRTRGRHALKRTQE